jgi:adenylyl- and sulfurtransferase ThiI
MGRIEIVVGPNASREEVAERIRHSFGVANFSYARRTALDLDVVAAAILRESRRPHLSSFACRAARRHTLSDDLAPGERRWAV